MPAPWSSCPVQRECFRQGIVPLDAVLGNHEPAVVAKLSTVLLERFIEAVAVVFETNIEHNPVEDELFR